MIDPKLIEQIVSKLSPEQAAKVLTALAGATEKKAAGSNQGEKKFAFDPGFVWPETAPDGTPFPSYEEVNAGLFYGPDANGVEQHKSKYLTNAMMRREKFGANKGKVVVRPKFYDMNKVTWVYGGERETLSAISGQPIPPNTWRAYFVYFVNGAGGGKRYDFYTWPERNHLYQRLGRPLDETAVEKKPVVVKKGKVVTPTEAAVPKTTFKLPALPGKKK